MRRTGGAGSIPGVSIEEASPGHEESDVNPDGYRGVVARGVRLEVRHPTGPGAALSTRIAPIALSSVGSFGILSVAREARWATDHTC